MKPGNLSNMLKVLTPTDIDLRDKKVWITANILDNNNKECWLFYATRNIRISSERDEKWMIV